MSEQGPSFTPENKKGKIESEQLSPEQKILLLDSVIHDHQQRLENNQEPYFSTDSIENLKQISEIDLSVVNLEQIKKAVSQPGTMTHTMRHTTISSGQLSPVIFWGELGLGKKQKHQHNIEGESAVSFNVTCPDGYNPSIETKGKEGGTYCLKDQKASLVDTGLVTFSKSALEKMACYSFCDGKTEEEKFGIKSTGYYIGEIIDQMLNSGSCYGKFLFQELKGSFGIEFQSYKMTFVADEMNCADLIVYAHLCLKYLKNPNELNIILNNHDGRRGYENISNIIETENYRSNFGYRFRGIAQEMVRERGRWDLYYDNIDPEPEDISSITLLNSTKEEKYLSINFKKHPPLIKEK